MFTKIKDFFIGIWKKIVDKATNIWNSFIVWLKGIWTKIKDFFVGIFNKIVGFFK